MELSEKCKKWYWILLICIITILLLLFYSGIFSKDDKIFYTLFVLWIILLLLPFISEINIFGFKIKKEIKELKDHVDTKVSEIKTEIRTNVKQQVYVGYGAPPSDQRIPELEEKIKALEEKYSKADKKKESKDSMLSLHLDQGTGLAGRFTVSETTSKLFAIRYTFEKLISDKTLNGYKNVDSPNHIFTRVCENPTLYIQSSTNNYNTVFNKNNTGKVGIGTSTPTEKLTVAGNVRIRDTLKLGNTLHVDSLAGPGFKFDSLSINTYHMVYADQDGNLVSKVNPNIGGSGLYIPCVTSITTAPWLLGGNYVPNGQVSFIGTCNHAPFSIYTYGQQRMIITESGKVGIGTAYIPILH